jgi:catechol 2,3-dioxygenase
VPNHRASERPYGVVPPGYRLPEATRVGAVHLQVSDLDRSVAYYERVTGLRTWEASTESATLGAHGDSRPLVTLRTNPGVTSARRGAFGLYHFAILLPERASLGRFAAHLSALDVRVGMADHLVSEAIYLWDPDGLGIEVYADRPRHTWQRRGQELAMTTDPLDVEALIAAGGREAWNGAPAGTTIGHVHLHVGSLEAADAFYHRALGFDKTVWTYPGALFLAAGGYHHHLGTNTWSPGPSSSPPYARLLAWELIVPSEEDVGAVAGSLRQTGYDALPAEGMTNSTDPWGTQLHVRPQTAASTG